MDRALSKAPLGGKKTGPNPTDRGKRGGKQSLLTAGHGVPIGLVLDGARAAGLSKSYQEQLARMLRATDATFEDIAGGGSAESRHMAPSPVESAG